MPAVLILLLLVLGSAGVCFGGPFPQENGEAVIKAAVVQAHPSIVRIETVGGADVIGDLIAGTGPTTGVIVSADGYIITSSYNFVANPASILVTLPDSQQRLPAEIIARDHLKQLTLIKVEAENLTPAEAVPEEEIRIGQWAIALGRTYDPVQPNLSLGLVSAIGRMEGRALQTDAKVSPANYGGPLIDLSGRVFGVLAPLSAPGKGMTDGMNWYDSGIGFAIPLTQIQLSLERLQSGTDLHPGLVGVSFEASPGFLTKPVVQEVRPNSPAAQAGMQPQDRIIRAEEKPVSTVAGIKQVLGTRYAGDTVRLTIERDQQELTVEVKLAEKLEPFQFGWLGLIGPREAAETEGELQIAQVLPGSPAAEAGLQKQDVIVRVDQVTPESWQQFRNVWFLKAAGQTVELEVRRGEETLTFSLELQGLPDSIPEDMPTPVMQAEAPPAGAARPTGDQTFTPDGHERSYKLFVPDEAQSGVPLGLLVWLSSNGDPIPATQLAEWKRICRGRGYVLLQLTAEALQPWSADDTNWILATIQDVSRRYVIDQERTCLIAAGSNPLYAWQFAFEHREQIKGLIAFGLPGRFRTPFNEPGQRLPIVLAAQAERELQVQERMQSLLENEGYAVLISEWKVPLSAEQFDELGRWLELSGSY